MTAVGEVTFVRRYWKCTCGSDGSYAADAVLGVEGVRYTQTVQKHCCRLAAHSSFATASEDLREMLGVHLCAETVRTLVHGHGKKMTRFQARDVESERAFAQAQGEVEFTVDAAKVHVRHEGWKDLKIAVIAKREAAKPMEPQKWRGQRLPAATMVLAFAMIATAKEFRRSWRSRLRRLGVRWLAMVHALGDGASWIWKAVQRSLSGCLQTLDFFHACEHLHKCSERIFGEGSQETREAYDHARGLLIRQGWTGVCQWVGELLQVQEEAELERRRRATDKLIGYFIKHINRLDYADRLRTGRPIGSGMVEGEAKTLGLRLKRRGARWNKGNVRPMASLVCVRHTAQWESYWNMAV